MMQMHKKTLLLSVALLVMLLLSACSIAGSSAQTSQQVLQKSLNAMKQLKAAHVDMTLASTVNYDASSTASAQKPFTLNVTASGDEVLPDRASLHVALGQGAISLSAIVVGKQLYIQNGQGQWYSLDASMLKGVPNNALAQINPASYNNLLAIAQKASYTDHGVQTLNGVSLRHITVTFDKSALKDLLNATGQASSLSASQRAKLDTLMNNVKLVNPTLDLWIDESTSYVHRMELKFSMNVNMSAMQGSGTSTTPSSTPSNLTTSVDTTIDFSKFNEAITISAPSNAIPANNLFSVFGG